MKIKKQELEVLFNLTKGTEGVLNLAESRTRDVFIKPLSEDLQAYHDQRDVIYKHFCVKREDGTPDIIEDKYQFEKEVLEELNAELITLGAEEVELKSDNIKEILEKSEYKPKIGEAEIIDQLLTKI